MATTASTEGKKNEIAMTLVTSSAPVYENVHLKAILLEKGGVKRLD